ncbi:MAG: class B sortase [Eubacterium sp.]|jgi:sortase B|nr:class B sortase [Eubacterium sp.]
MALEWTAEQQALLCIKKIIARAWRMNRQQLRSCCAGLRRKQAQLLPGRIGSAFLDKLEQLSAREAEEGAKDWPNLMNDTSQLLNLIRRNQHLSRKEWLAVLPKLETQKGRYFKSELGAAFVTALKEKLGIAVPALPEAAAPVQEAGKNAALGNSGAGKVLRSGTDSKAELEHLAAWLMQDADGRQKNHSSGQKTGIHAFRNFRNNAGQPGSRHRHGNNTSRRTLLPERLQSAAVPVFACLSVCFLSVWLYGQAARNHTAWSAQQMKVSASRKAGGTAQENPQDSPADANQAGSQSGEGLPADNAQGSGGPQSGLSVEKTLAKDGLQADSKTEKQESGKTARKKRPKILEQYQEMAEEYPGLYGWLQIPGTQIDLPVMQPYKENEYYLDHDFTGADSAEGALFADPENSRFPQDGNTIIYGHNMKNGHMFGLLNLFEDAAYFKTHKEILFDTIYETGVYEAVAVIKTRILNENEQGFRYYQFFQYENEDEFQECADFVERNRMFATGSSLQYGDKILMLSTCEYSQENGRLLIVARKTG